MALSKEQKRKLDERMAWLLEDQTFRDSVSNWLGKAIDIGYVMRVVTCALERLEEEKVAITGKGRYQDQCEELVENADTFFGNYQREVKQLGLSVFRFTHRVLEDHLGEEPGLRAFTLGKAQVINALDHVFSTVRLLVVDNKVR